MTAISKASAPLDAREEAFWRAFTRAMIVVPRVLDAELVAEQGLSMSEYSALMHLSEAPDRQLRMTELASVCALSLSGMTRIVSRLAGQGLVVRVKCASDARGAFASLTDRGLACLRDAYPSHLASVRRHVIDNLGDVDMPALTVALNRFVTDESLSGCPTTGGPGVDEPGVDRGDVPA
jgi:DNA-binding MarR family transcriptional regulator